MTVKLPYQLIAGLLSLSLASCYQPPYNNFKPYQPGWKKVAVGLGVGTVVGAAAGNTLAGTAIGGLAGAAVAAHEGSRRHLLQELNAQNIQYVEYGDTKSLIVPTDQYYLFNSAQLNDLCFPGLMNIIKLVKQYPPTPIYVAAFTDNIGTKAHKKKLSQARAETMVSFLWANGIDAQCLHGEGYSDKHSIGDNKIIHGSAFNRRIELQWFTAQKPHLVPYRFAMK